MNKKYIAAAVIAIIISAYALYSLNGNGKIEKNGEGGGLVIQGDVVWVVGNTTYHLGNISTNRIIISDDYLIVGNTIYGEFIYAMMVNSSWNLISWPTPEIIPKENITVIYNGIYTWQEACDNIIIAPFVFMYDGNAYVETEYFYPYYGYWLYSHHDGVVLCLI